MNKIYLRICKYSLSYAEWTITFFRPRSYSMIQTNYSIFVSYVSGKFNCQFQNKTQLYVFQNSANMVTIYVKKVGPKCGKIVFIDLKILAVNYTRFKLFEFIRLLILYVYLQPEPSKKGNEFFLVFFKFFFFKTQIIL